MQRSAQDSSRIYLLDRLLKISLIAFHLDGELHQIVFASPRCGIGYCRRDLLDFSGTSPFRPGVTSTLYPPLSEAYHNYLKHNHHYKDISYDPYD